MGLVENGSVFDMSRVDLSLDLSVFTCYLLEYALISDTNTCLRTCLVNALIIVFCDMLDSCCTGHSYCSISLIFWPKCLIA